MAIAGTEQGIYTLVKTPIGPEPSIMAASSISYGTPLKKLSEKEIEELLKVNLRTFNAAQLIIAMLPMLLAYPFFQRFFITGLTLGGVKG